MAAKYDSIGTGYNTTRKADPYLTQKLLEHLQPTLGGRYLDIGCGTGNYTDALARQGIRLIGIDPSEKMLAQARAKNDTIDWRIGTAENIPLANNTVDGALGTLTIHHWTAITKGCSELYRVVKPTGRIVIFTSTPEQMQGYWLNHYFPKMLRDSMLQMPSLEVVENAMKDSGLEVVAIEKYSIQPDLQDQFLYVGKHQPEIYFDQRVRNGISSFSALSNRTEVEEGLAQLKKDIDSGKIGSVMEAYPNDLGDYLYIIANKPVGSKAKIRGN